MEILAAVALAGNVLQFTESGVKLLFKVREILDKGALKDDLEAAASAGLFVEVSDAALDQCHGFNLKVANDARFVESADELAQSNELLEKVTNDCQDVANRLINKFDSIKVPIGSGGKTPKRSKWKAFRLGLQRTWSTSEIDSLKDQLANAREAVNSTILVSLSAKMNAMMTVTIEQSHKFNSLSSENRILIQSLFSQQETTNLTLESQTRALSLLLSRTELLVARNERLIENVVIKDREFEVTKPHRRRDLIDDAMAAPSATMHSDYTAKVHAFALQEKSIRETVAGELLKSLGFDSLQSRYTAVDDAYTKTFSWIFTDAAEMPGKGPEKRIWSDFRSFLTSNEKLYWISGKPASGKSTLMKFIILHPSTEMLLQQWKLDSPVESDLNVGKFFFWSSGSKDQRSQVGLLRSLLYELCQRRPQLLPIAFPEEWSRRYVRTVNKQGANSSDAWFLNLTAFARPSWTLKSLKNSLICVLSQTQYPIKTCLFVDGLDEFEGEDLEIAEFFKGLSELPNVKCLISSRPHQAFIDAFHDKPSLRLQDFTYADIAHYVEDRLRSHTNWIQLAEQAPGPAEALQTELVSSAQGVFLWVKLVVTSIIRGLGNKDAISDLQRRLQETPKELTGLYNQIIFNADRFYESERGIIFRLVQAASAIDAPLTELTLFQLALASELDLVSAVKPPNLTQQMIEEKSQNMTTRVITRCGGLLEIQKQVSMIDHSPGLGVSFLHRTVKDYLDEEETRLQLRIISAKFTPLYGIMAAYIIQLNVELNSQLRLSPAQPVERLIKNTMQCLYMLQADDAVTQARYLQLCSEVFRLVEKLAWSNEGVKKEFPPRRPRTTVAVEYRLHRYLKHLFLEASASEITKTSNEGLDTLLEMAIACGSYQEPDLRDILLERGADPVSAWHRWSQFHCRRSDYDFAHAQPILKFFAEAGVRFRPEEWQELRQHLPEDFIRE
ncbi:P-loop containing nucleoside triphosphate hydrolase [Paramyrothecium foliicola]|nr:P-loop containing nucleoside triphosphate hydrolase [Paramyrothecium foliicola]